MDMKAGIGEGLIPDARSKIQSADNAMQNDCIGVNDGMVTRVFSTRACFFA
jgi:hypothetical protein